MQTCLIDDVGPMPVARPGSVAELAELVRQARDRREPLFPLGGRTHLGIGLPPERPGLGVDLTRLDAVLDYPARDMTITVGAGITLGALAKLLAEEKQRLPIDVPRSETATLGGALAVNASGPRRLGCGTLRDYVIGISTVNDEGHEVKAGGRVVKNVAGYDLCKLHVGALGSLGVITQVTLKLKPVPEANALTAFGCSAALLEGHLDAVHQSRTQPVCVEVFNPAAAAVVLPGDTPRWHPDEWLIVVGYEGGDEVVRWQSEQLAREAGERNFKGLTRGAGDEVRDFWQALVNFRLPPLESVLTFKANLLPHGVAAFCVEASRADASLLLQAHAGSGIVVGHLTHLSTMDSAVKSLTQLRQLASPHQGSVVVLSAPPAWKTALAVWGPPRGDWTVMRQVKEKLDPLRLFNPGRFVDAL